MGISELTEMQQEAIEMISTNAENILISPTGTGKTLAFLLPLINDIEPSSMLVQALIVVPTRELAIQIEQVVRDMGTGIKCNAVYGGQSFSKDRINLQHPPAMLVGTPGRLADHLRRRTFEPSAIRALVLDEFDKSLEIGFEEDMRFIVRSLSGIKKRVLTSATAMNDIPDFVGMKTSKTLNYTELTLKPSISLRLVEVSNGNKYNAIVALLKSLGDQSGVVFCNLKESIDGLSQALNAAGIAHGIFHGGIEQQDRERSLIKFRNGTHNVLVATDLAARGIDVPEMGFIVHFELPLHAHEFVHRNGRTGRMQQNGTAYILKSLKDHLPTYAAGASIHIIGKQQIGEQIPMATLMISGGRRDKISKGDIAGLLIKQGGVPPTQLGVIELKQDCAFVSVAKQLADQAIKTTNGKKLKTKKIKVVSV